jgi:hypothetical protein
MWSARAPRHARHLATRIPGTIAPAAHAICDILATNVGIVRKACRGRENTPQVLRSQPSACSQQAERPGIGRNPYAPSPAAPATGGVPMDGLRGLNPPTRYASAKASPHCAALAPGAWQCSAGCGMALPPPDDLRTIATFSARMRQTTVAPCSTFRRMYEEWEPSKAR